MEVIFFRPASATLTFLPGRKTVVPLYLVELLSPFKRLRITMSLQSEAILPTCWKTCHPTCGWLLVAAPDRSQSVCRQRYFSRGFESLPELIYQKHQFWSSSPQTPSQTAQRGKSQQYNKHLKLTLAGPTLWGKEVQPKRGSIKVWDSRQTQNLP